MTFLQRAKEVSFDDHIGKLHADRTTIFVNHKPLILSRKSIATSPIVAANKLSSRCSTHFNDAITYTKRIRNSRFNYIATIACSPSRRRFFYVYHNIRIRNRVKLNSLWLTCQPIRDISLYEKPEFLVLENLFIIRVNVLAYTIILECATTARTPRLYL